MNTIGEHALYEVTQELHNFKQFYPLLTFCLKASRRPVVLAQQCTSISFSVHAMVYQLISNLHLLELQPETIGHFSFRTIPSRDMEMQPETMGHVLMNTARQRKMTVQGTCHIAVFLLVYYVWRLFRNASRSI